MTGRVALVTGGLSGIGLAAAQALAEAGHLVAVCSRRGDGPEADTAREVLGQDALIGAADIADRASINAFADRVRAEMGAPSILVNAAGIYRESFLDRDDADAAWSDQIATNLDGAWNAIRTIWPDMLAAKWGRVVLIASTAGSVGAAGYAGYCASKAGVIALTKSLGKEHADQNIAVNCVTPAAARTRIFDQMSQEHIDFMLAKIPRGRFLEVDEAAAMIAWLCSAENSFTTGAVFDLSGGRATY